ncbi:MAG TPA: SCO family protein [Candidatus Polarisedimenticolaceae bacterium]
MNAFALAVVLAATAVPAVSADRTEPLPKELEGVGVDEKLDAQVPLDLEFTDDLGRKVTLRDFVRGDKPVVLTLNYYRCPMLCTLVLNGYIEGLKALDWYPGGEFTSVTVSIDPRELPTLARAKKQNYLEEYGKPLADRGWPFLVGSAESVKRLTDAVGFRYTYDAQADQYAHAAVILVLTPEGRVSKYLYGVKFEPATLRLALVEASEGRIGSALDQLILYCYHYDPSTGTYAPAALKIMRFGAILTTLVLAVVLGSFWAREFRRRSVA